MPKPNLTQQDCTEKNSASFLDSLSSKVRRIYIPLAGFRYFHRPSEVKDVDPYFIGRRQILRQLSNWLNDKDGNYTGAYLITGYRGMGKTSFVSKVIDNLIKKQEGTSQSLHKIILSVVAYSITFALILMSAIYIYPLISEYYKIAIGIFMALCTSYYFLLPVKRIIQYWEWTYPYLIDFFSILPLFVVLLYLISPNQNLLISLGVLFIIYLLVLLVGRPILQKFPELKHKYILQIKVNIGNEVSETKDVLALFAYSIKNRISTYIHKKSHTFVKNVAVRGIQWSIVAYIGINLYKYTLPILQPVAWKFYGAAEKGMLLNSLEALNNILYQFRIQHSELAQWAGMLVACLIALGVTRFIRKLLDYSIKYVGGSWPKATEIEQELNKLCERIDATVQEDKGTPLGNISMSVFNIAFTRRKSQNYRPASIREIEQSLINIIQQINDSKILNCRMIIILDELDKLSSQKSSETKTDIVYPEFTVDENGVSDDISVNEKKHRILSLLGQLKYFITSAKAKFIFIAGHELYDAYLADVSDREYSISSIFNGVINVDSFFTCDQHINDITRLTEAFLCKHLIPQTQTKDEQRICCSRKKQADTERYTTDDERYTFSAYAEHIKEHIKKNKSKALGLTTHEIEAVLSFLRQFVTYLTFTSNGAPKKLITTLEKYVISNEEYKKQREQYASSIITLPIINDAGNENCYYLAFGYYDQQKIGFIHYIANPIFENIISPSSEFGDKLLVASSFLIAHIYKYHNCGFSRRNLEYMPELLDSNRSPELRSFIDSIIGYLGQIHLTSITSGIYTYKFPMRLSEEISMFSKKSEEISAIFNFSLDDSLAVKKLYYRLFDFYHQKQKGTASIKSAFHHNLGDIHLANKEYTEAIAQYRQTAQAIDAILQEFVDKKADCAYIGTIVSQIMRYTRVMLKLGLAYEKRNSLDSAYTIYSTLTTRLIAFREIDVSPLGLTHTIVRSSEKDTDVFNPDHKRVLIYKKEIKRNSSTFDQECYIRTEGDVRNYDYWTYGDELTDNLCDQLSPKKYALISKLSVFEDLRLAYLPILAKLFVIEKHNICGITKDNVKVADAEFKYLFHITNSKDKYLLRVDFYRKLGDILYYKNGALYKGHPNSIMSIISNWGYDLKSEIFDYCYQFGLKKKKASEIIELFESQNVVHDIKQIENIKELITGNKPNLKYNTSETIKLHVDKIIDKLPSYIKQQCSMINDCLNRRSYLNIEGDNTLVPCAACNCYARSLSILFFRLTGNNNSNNIAYELLKAYEANTLQTKQYNELTQTALTLSSMGNVLLSCAKEDDKLSSKFISAIFKTSTQRDEEEISKLSSPCGHLERAILHYWTAMQYHYLASNYKEGILCLTWIFNIISAFLAEVDNESESCIFENACIYMETTVKNAMVHIHSMRDFAGLKETNKMKQILTPLDIWSNLGLNSVMPDAEELLLVYYEVLLSQSSQKRKEYLSIIGYLYNSPSLTYLRNESLTYNRVISLLFKTKLNERLLWLLIGKKLTIYNEIQFKSIESEVKNEIISFLNHNNYSAPNISNESLIKFLITDSIFCLTSIIDFIQPTARTSLFTNSFCLSVYKRLYQWVCLKEEFARKYPELATTLDNEINQSVEFHNRNILKRTYLKGMINKYYSAARAMHSGGLEYQTFISDMYLLDDDLQNNTCQFYFALERYKIRTSHVEQPSIQANAYFTPESYFKNKVH